MIVKERELTYTCPECGGCGQELDDQSRDHPQKAGAERGESECPLCRGRGRVTARELLENYCPGTD